MALCTLVQNFMAILVRSMVCAQPADLIVGGVRVNFHHGVRVNPVVIVSVTFFYVPSFLVDQGGVNEIFFH